MTPIKFTGSNVVIAENQPPYTPLPARFLGDKMGTCVMCFELTEEEIRTLQQTKKLWITVLTFNQRFQPIMLTTDKPQWSLPGQVDIVQINLETKAVEYTDNLAWDVDKANSLVRQLNRTNLFPTLTTFATTRSDEN